MPDVPRRGLTAVSLPVVASLVCGAVAGLCGFTVHYAEGLSYLSSDPRACVNCHVMQDQYDGWQKASHHTAATCTSCHTPHDFIGKYFVKAENGYSHSKAFTLQDFPEPIMIRPRDARVLQGTCIDCHRNMADTVLGHGDTRDGGAATCARCHAAVGHGPRK